MGKIFLFLAEGFEEIEALTVVDLCRRATLDIETVSLTGDRAVKGSHDIPVTADIVIESVNFDECDMIVLPGGMPGTLNLGLNATLTAQLEAFDKAKRRIAAICAAPGILGRMGILDGKEAVCHPSVEKELKGATIPDKEVAHDGHIITSRGLGTAIPFALEIMREFVGADKAAELAKGIVYRQYE